MINFFASNSAAQLADHLQASTSEFAEEERSAITHFLKRSSNPDKPNVFLTLLIGFGTLFLIFHIFIALATFGLLDTMLEPKYLFAVSILLLLLSLGMLAAQKHLAEPLAWAADIGSVAILESAKLCFAGCVLKLTPGHITIPLFITVAAMTLATWFLYNNKFDQYVSLFATFSTAILAILYDQKEFLPHTALIDLVIATLIAILIATALLERRNRFTKPLLLISAIILAGFMFYAMNTGVSVDHFDMPDHPLLFVSLLGFAAMLFAIARSINGRITRINIAQLVAIFLLTALIGYLIAPSFVLAILLITAGYWLRYRLLVIGGIVAIPALIGTYYFNTGQLLLTKSVDLLVVGFVLLAACAALHFITKIRVVNP